MLAKKTFNDPKIRRSTFFIKYRGTGTVGTWYGVPVPLLKMNRGTFVHGTAHLW